MSAHQLLRLTVPRIPASRGVPASQPTLAEPRRGLTALASRAEPYTQEERDFVTAFARALSHATAVVAADPTVSVTEGSIAHRVQQAYLGFRADQRRDMQQRARSLLSDANERKLRYFGAYADRGPEAWTNGERGLGRALTLHLREAVRARLRAQRHEIGELLAAAVATELRPGLEVSGKTSLEVGHFSGDVHVGSTELHINKPGIIHLRWETNVEGAERGVWQLLKGGRSLGQSSRRVVLGTGHAGAAPGAVFTIDLAKYLPAEPPAVPANYVIRVIPGSKPELRQGRGRGDVVTVPGKAVGPPSNDVLITYSAVPPPGVTFEIFEIYQAASFDLESIRMVEDQFGGGAEEFHVAGFVQESFLAGSSQPGTQDRFGPFYAKLDPSGPRWAKIPHSHTFYLNKPDSPEWPRVYSVIISVMEQDDGGALNEWESRVWSVADELASGAVSQEIREFLQDEFQEFIGDNVGELLQSGGEIAKIIIDLVAGSITAVVGMVTAAVALVATDIVSGMADDYYGTEVFVFALPTNITDFVNSLPGHTNAYGSWQLETETLAFRGHTAWPEATVFDGEAHVYFHFEFFDKYVT